MHFMVQQKSVHGKTYLNLHVSNGIDIKIVPDICCIASGSIKYFLFSVPANEKEEEGKKKSMSVICCRLLALL